jgi:hypothetical protein
MNNNNICPSIVLIVIFLIIGFPMFFSGCVDGLQKNCGAFDRKIGIIINQTITNSTCKYCTSYTRKCDYNSAKCNERICESYNYYTCYDSYIVVSYDNNENKTCIINIYKDNTNYQDKIYIIGSTYNLYISKINGECVPISSVEGIAIAGFMFLMFAALITTFTLLYLIIINYNNIIATIILLYLMILNNVAKNIYFLV